MEALRPFQRLWKDRRPWLWGVLGIGLLGAVLASLPPDRLLARASYDFPYQFKRPETNATIAIVYVDDQTLGQWTHFARQPRSYHARLLRRLQADGARLVGFDFLLDTAAPDPEEDREFAAALSASGFTVLAAHYAEQQTAAGPVRTIKPPTQVLTLAVSNRWGLADLDADPDGAVRRLYPGWAQSNAASFAWVAARTAGPPGRFREEDRVRERWLFYPGPPRGGSFPVYSLTTNLLSTNATPTGRFKDRIVLVGDGRLAADLRTDRDGLNRRPDTFRQPYVPDTPGVEIHATALWNLLEGTWLRRLAAPLQVALCFSFGTLLGLGLLAARPRLAVALAFGIAASVAAGSIWMELSPLTRTWWCWLIPVGVQSPLALALALFANTRRAPGLAATYDVFISYRRDPGAPTAMLVRNELRSRGYAVFLDVEDIGSTQFDQRLIAAIDASVNVVVVLSPGALISRAQPGQEDYFFREIEHSLSRGKNVIPFFLPGFGFPPQAELPAAIAPLALRNGISYLHEDFVGTIRRLESFLVRR